MARTMCDGSDNSNGSTSRPPATVRRARLRPRVSLKWLLVIVAVVAVILASLAPRWWKARRQRQAVQAFLRLGADVWYGYQLENIARDARGNVIDTRHPHDVQQSAVPHGAAWLNRLLGVDCVNRVRELFVEAQDEPITIGRTEGEQLAACPQLRRLSLVGVRILPAATGYFGSLAALEDLDLGDSHLPRSLVATIGELRRLRYLDLSGTNLVPDDVACLAPLQQLTSLDLSRTAVTDRSLRPLMNLHRLAHLTLRDTPVTDEGVRMLRRHPVLKLTPYDVHGTAVSHPSSLAGSTSLPGPSKTSLAAPAVETYGPLPP